MVGSRLGDPVGSISLEDVELYYSSVIIAGTFLIVVSIDLKKLNYTWSKGLSRF